MLFRLSSLSVLLLALLSLGGCRVGTKTVTTYQGYDLLSGYYANEPRAYKVTVQIQGEASPRIQSISPNQMPPVVTDVMTNPVMVYFEDPINGIASLRNPAQTSTGFQVNLDPNTQIISSTLQSSLQGPNCVLVQSVSRSGNLAQYPTPTLLNTYSTRGALNLDYTISEVFQGTNTDCSAWLQILATCYANATTCDATTSSSVHFIFDPFLNAGIITAADLTKVQSTSFTASFRVPGTP